MANIKWGITAGGVALFISVIMGILSGVGGFYIFLRALIFLFVFFGIGFGLRLMINSFFPELLFSDDGTAVQETEQAGSQVNIILDSIGEYAVPELFKSQSDELGNIEDLLSGGFTAAVRQKPSAGIDRKREAGYNKFEVLPEADNFSSGGLSAGFNQEAGFKPTDAQSYQSFTPSFGDDMELSGLPDLDVMARAFSGASAGGPPIEAAAGGFGAGMSDLPSLEPASGITSSASPVFEAEEMERRTMSSNKAQPMQGDWDAKGLAEGIRTVLSKER